METEAKRKKEKVKYIAKMNCKQCYGRGVVLRTLPRGKEQNGKKRMIRKTFRCVCVKEVRISEEGAKGENV